MAESNPGDPLELAPSLVVVIDQAGISVPNPQGWAVPADLDRLDFLQAVATGGHRDLQALISQVAAEHGDGRMALFMFAQTLRAGALMTEGLSAETSDVRSRRPSVVSGHAPIGAIREPMVLETPLVFALSPDGFSLFDHDGRPRVTLQVVEMDAAAAFREPSTIDEAYELHCRNASARALDRARFDALVERLGQAGALRHFDRNDARDVVSLGIGPLMARNEARAFEELQEAVDRSIERHEAAQALRPTLDGTPRVKVVPVTFNGTMPPLALGLLFTYAKSFEGGRLEQVYDFHPGWLTDEQRLAELARRPGVFLFSNYVWSHERCLAASELVKSIDPRNVTVHGGPSTPKYEGDVEEYLGRYPHIDVVVRGEGEATTAHLLAGLEGYFAHGDHELADHLGEVAGLSFRHDGGIVRTPDRDRISDLDMIPSPYLTGLFDAYGEVPRLSATLETNRGCPYGCTFCDWGSATLSRIRKFDLDRVMAELDWCAEHQVISVGLTDANFGIWERDVEIAERVVALKQRTGFPTGFGANYAKNTTKHLRQIIEMLVDSGIISQGVLALQSMDSETLVAIDRSNIKLEKYEELATEFRKAKLPLFVDLMVGLPGQTLGSFENDLQQCADREVQARLPITQMLVNSPMNDPAYREKHKIELTASPVGPEQPRVVATSSFTRDDYEQMLALRSVFILAENLGVLRQVGRYVRHERGVREVDLYHGMLRDTDTDPDRWPYLRLTLKTVPIVMAPPVSWSFMIGDLASYLVERHGLVADSALDTVLTVQRAVLPGRDRLLPQTVPLSHDYVAWFDAMLEAKEHGHREDWPDHVPPLRSFPPGELSVDDPRAAVTSAGIGAPFEFHGTGLHWELQSPLGRIDVQEDATIEQLIVTT